MTSPVPLAVAAIVLLAFAGTCGGPGRMESIGGAWLIEDVPNAPKPGLQPRNLVRESGGRRVVVDSLVEYWRFHAPDCVVYQTAREQHEVRAVCGDGKPVPIARSSAVQWRFAADGLHRVGIPYVAGGRAVQPVEFIPMETIVQTAMQKSPAPVEPIREERPIDPNVLRPDGNTPLIDAAVRGRLELVDALLTAGADPNGRAASGTTALMVAANLRQLPIVERLLAAGADVNVQDETGRTALMTATGIGATEIVRRLLAAGADRSLRDAEGRTAYDLLTHNPDAELRALVKP